MKRSVIQKVCCVLVGAKCDLSESRAVSFEQGQELADNNEMKFIELSSKSGINIEECYQYLIGDILTKLLDSEGT